MSFHLNNAQQMAINDSLLPQSQAKFQSKSRTFFHSCKTKKIKAYFLLSFRFLARKLGPLILMIAE